jgi:hypothetical protein
MSQLRLDIPDGILMSQCRIFWMPLPRPYVYTRMLGFI